MYNIAFSLSLTHSVFYGEEWAEGEQDDDIEHEIDPEVVWKFKLKLKYIYNVCV